MSKKVRLFCAVYTDPRHIPGGLATDFACCIPDDKILESMRASGQAIYICGKEVKGKINRTSLKDTALCPNKKKDCPHFSEQED